MLRRPPRPHPFPYATLFRASSPSPPRIEQPVAAGAGFRPSPLRRRGAGAMSLSDPGRIGTLDILRGVAVLGILAMNVVDFALDRKSTRLNSSHAHISHALFC